MTAKNLTSNEIQCLADDVRAKILANEDVIARSKNPIVIQIHRGKGQDFEIDLITKT